MSVTICMIGLMIVALCAWHAFWQELADAAQYKRHLEEQKEKIRSFELGCDEQDDRRDITVA